MGQPGVMPRIPDGYRHGLAELATFLDEAAHAQQTARHGGGNRVEALTCASIDAERAIRRAADWARRLRR